jgi:hypothetical protein
LADDYFPGDAVPVVFDHFPEDVAVQAVFAPGGVAAVAAAVAVEDVVFVAVAAAWPDVVPVMPGDFDRDFVAPKQTKQCPV